MKLEVRKYENIVDLYQTQQDFKEAFDNNQGNTLENYMDDYCDRDGIILSILDDVIDRNEYEWKTSGHQYWEDVRINIRKK